MAKAKGIILKQCPPCTAQSSHCFSMSITNFPVPPEIFASLGNDVLRKTNQRSNSVSDRRFRGLFGTTPLVCARLWELVLENVPPAGRPKHLLWALLFLKVYAIEHVNAALVHSDEKTFRKWSWEFVQLLSFIEVVRI